MVLLGRGAHRHVYEHEKGVIKFPHKDKNKVNNLWEYEVWQLAVKYNMIEYFVPVIDVASDGSWLLMERAVPLENKNKIPPKLSWMQDYKYSNFGIHDGKIKLLDYGNHKIIDNIKQIYETQ